MELYPDDSVFWLRGQYSLEAMGQIDEARGIARTYAANHPDDSEAWYELGTAEEGLGKMDEAQQAFRKAVALNPGHSDALFRIGVYAAKHGDRDEMRNIGITLAKLDNQMAEEYNKAVGCATEC